MIVSSTKRPEGRSDYHTHALVLDFDGTICLGDAPVLAFAEFVAEELENKNDERAPVPGGPVTDERLIAVLTYFLETGGRYNSQVLAELPLVIRGGLEAVRDSVDGYQAVTTIGEACGLTADELSHAYLDSRKMLEAGLLETYMPSGLDRMLLELPDYVRVVLVTNSPGPGILRTLDQFGITKLIHEIVPSAGKPDGMAVILERVLYEIGAESVPQRIFCVGDIWINDLAFASQLGARTGLIERFPTLGSPDYRASSIEELYPRILSWASEVAAEDQAHPQTGMKSGIGS